MTTRALLIGLAFLATGLIDSATAQIKFRRESPPPLIAEGLDKLRTGSAKEAVQVWFTGSSVDENNDVQEQFTQQFESLIQRSGKLRKVEHIETMGISNSLRSSYYVLIFERGVVLAEFSCFQGTDSWTCSNILTSLNPSDIFPSFPYIIEE